MIRVTRTDSNNNDFLKEITLAILELFTQRINEAEQALTAATSDGNV